MVCNRLCYTESVIGPCALMVRSEGNLRNADDILSFDRTIMFLDRIIHTEFGEGYEENKTDRRMEGLQG